MSTAGALLLACVATGAAVFWFRRWRRAVRIIGEWHGRWDLAPEYCAAKGCLQPPEADCHVPADMEARALWGHRFVHARLVLAPDPLARQAIGAPQ